MTYYGLYKITNLRNGKMYIGQHTTDDLDDGYMGSGKIMKQALKKYGVENFRKEWIMFCEDADELNYWEMVFVDETWVMRSDTYNLCVGGRGYNHMKGRHHTEETKRKMREAMKGKYDGAKHPCFGKPRTEETRRKIGKSHLGIGHTEDAKRKMSEAHKGRSPWIKGRHHTEETKRKIGETHKGRPSWNKGKRLSEEHKRKLSESHKRRST